MTNPLLSNVVALNSKTYVNADEITLLEAEINYTKVYFEEKTPLVLATTLKKIEPILKAHGFVRIHRKFMLHACYLNEALLDNDIIVVMNDIEIKVSRRKRGELKKIIRQRGMLAA